MQTILNNTQGTSIILLLAFIAGFVVTFVCLAYGLKNDDKNTTTIGFIFFIIILVTAVIMTYFKY